MEEPEKIVEVIKKHFDEKEELKGKIVLITAGPTYEAVDPVRYIANHSTGTMGFALANVAAHHGASVVLITGPTTLTADHPHIHRIDVVTAHEMLGECLKHFPTCDICIMSAAVADFRPIRSAEYKIKKSRNAFSLELEPTEDILATLGKLKQSNQLLIGFALETNDEVHHAQEKLQNKNLDLIVLNSLHDEGAGFGFTTNKVTLIGKNRYLQSFDAKPKPDVAKDIFDWIVKEWLIS